MKKAKTWDFTHSLPRPPNASSVSRPAFPPFLNLPSLFGWLVLFLHIAVMVVTSDFHLLNHEIPLVLVHSDLPYTQEGSVLPHSVVCIS